MKIFITGLTGFFGRTLLNIVDRERFKEIGGLSRDEHKIGRMNAEFPEVRMYLGDVRIFDMLYLAMKDFRPDVIIHAAALKVVPLGEQHPEQYYFTNTIGTMNVLRVASYLSSPPVPVVLISSDKACAPHNAYGLSKRMAEKLVINARQTVVRFGNVFGSTGSVPYIWLDQFRSEKPITVVDREMTRFYLEAEDAVSFALNHVGRNGIFVPKLKSYTLERFFRAWFESGPDCLDVEDIDYIYPRPGEKMHEVLVSIDEAPFSLDLGDEILVSDYGVGLDPPEAFSSRTAEPVSDDILYDKLSEFWENNEL